MLLYLCDSGLASFVYAAEPATHYYVTNKDDFPIPLFDNLRVFCPKVASCKVSVPLLVAREWLPVKIVVFYLFLFIFPPCSRFLMYFFTNQNEIPDIRLFIV